MFRKPFRRAMGQGMRPDVPPLLRQGHQLMAAENYSGAAEAFEQLAQRAEARGGSRAGNFYLQAGRARILAGQKPAGMDNFKKGLAYMQKMSMSHRLAVAGNRVVQELNNHGMTAESTEIANWLKQNAPTLPPTTAAAGPAKKATLPTRCPGCGGPVKADEVDWVDDSTAECNWCGSPIRGE